MRVNIYTATGGKPAKRQGTRVGYLIEAPDVHSDKNTRDGYEDFEDITENQAELLALILALKRFRKPAELEIYTESHYLAAGFEQGWVESWMQNGWKTAREKEVANKMQWEELQHLLEKHTFTFRVKEKNEFTPWLKRQLDTEKEKNEE